MSRVPLPAPTDVVAVGDVATGVNRKLPAPAVVAELVTGIPALAMVLPVLKINTRAVVPASTVKLTDPNEEASVLFKASTNTPICEAMLDRDGWDTATKE